MKYIMPFLLIVFMMLLPGCSDDPVDSTSPDPTPSVVRTTAEMTAEELTVLESSNKFGIKAFKALIAEAGATDNVFFSPLSASYALSLCYNGADGTTREAIGSTLELANLSLEELNQAYQTATEILIEADEAVDFRVANSLWSRQGKEIEPEFIRLAQTYHDARVEEIDFQAAGAADTINAWVNGATNGLITQMVQPPIDPFTAAILFNAIYFKGGWSIKFDTAHTKQESFYLADGSNTECDMMHLGSDDFLVEYPGEEYPLMDTNVTSYMDDDVLVLGLPYGNGDFRMTLVLPASSGYGEEPDHTIDDIIAELTPEMWSSWQGRHMAYEMYLSLPKFKFGCDLPLNELLKSMGMAIAFTEAADFSNLFTDGVGWIDDVKQKTFIQLDEEGTEAAAVTQVTFVDALPPSFIFNRPFLAVIHEDNSGAILFMGRISNPVWED
ncbi:MAG TPA: serpin family protein [candidate division Zixibacteria bacterium]|nr:serpin family protein [candidate division Zixibacteria bacterium]